MNMGYTLEDIRNDLVASTVENPEWLKTLSGTEQAFMDMIKGRRELGFDFFVAVSFDAIHLVDTSDVHDGRRFSFPTDRYYVCHVAFGSLVLKDTLTGKEYTVFTLGTVSIKDVICFTGFSTKSSGKYRSVFIRYNYGFDEANIKMHHLVLGMLEGPIAVLQMRSELHGHHVNPEFKHRNTRGNLKLVTPMEHVDIHTELKREKKKKTGLYVV